MSWLDICIGHGNCPWLLFSDISARKALVKRAKVQMLKVDIKPVYANLSGYANI
jgi:hypothetical protein